MCVLGSSGNVHELIVGERAVTLLLRPADLLLDVELVGLLHFRRRLPDHHGLLVQRRALRHIVIDLVRLPRTQPTALTASSNSPSFCATVPLYSSPGAAQAPLLGLGCNTFASTLYAATAALPAAGALTQRATTPPTLPAPTVTVTASPRPTSLGVIVGSTLGGVALLALLLLVCGVAAAALRRRGRSRRGPLAWFGGGGGGRRSHTSGSRGSDASAGGETTEVVHGKHSGGGVPLAVVAAAVPPPLPTAPEPPGVGSEAGEMAEDASGDELRFSLPANYSPSPVLQEARAVPLQRVGELPAGVVSISELPDSAVWNGRGDDEDDETRHLGVAF
jgi:hypothetical protein